VVVPPADGGAKVKVTSALLLSLNTHLLHVTA
jgi:hypothetical protein